jgi:large subunit ribosomal protein L5
MQVRYHDNVVPALKEKFEYSNVMLVPRLSKIVVNTSIREATQNVKLLEAAAEEIAIITGQKAIIRRARRSIAGFKLREGMPIGAKTTLRR